MVEKELALTSQDVQVTPAKIKFSKYDEAKAYVDAERDKWTNYIVTAKDVKSAKDVCAELNKRKRAINDFRKNAVNQASEPISKFETQMNDLVKEYKEAYDSIRNQVKVYEKKAHDDRLKLKTDRIEKMCQEVGVDFEKIVVNDSWGNVNYSNKKFEKEVNQQIEELLKEQKQSEDNQAVVTQTADKLSLDAKPFLDMLGRKSLQEILKDMDDSRKRLDEISKDQEKTKKIDQENLIKNGKVINPKTGEVIDKAYTAVLVTKKAKIQIEGTKYQFDQLFSYLQDMGFKCEKVD